MTVSSRRRFLTQVAGAAGLGFFASCTSAKKPSTVNPFFEISLAEWSLHKSLFANRITNLDFPAISKNQYGIGVVEYVNQFFKDKANDTSYLNQLLQRCRDNDVKNHLIMIDGEGELGATDDTERKKTIENHYKWVDAAKYLGCATIRVNAGGNGTAEEVQMRAAESLATLGDYAAKENINVIVENHGGYSSNGQWLAGVMKAAGKSNVGTLPDFGNFCIKNDGGKCIDEYDRYKGVEELMPYAKGVSAKTFNFDDNGNCIETDYDRMIPIIRNSGFKGYIGIEYEGDNLSEEEGIKKTKALLEKYRAAV
jgi:sugar phosphate isomerase/epimerase